MKKIRPLFPITIAILLLTAWFQPCSAEISSEMKRTAAQYRDKGLSAQKNGDLQTALVYYQKAMELDPTLAEAYNDAGVIYEARGWHDKAKAAYGKALDLDPTLSSAYYNLGSLYEREGDLEKAVFYFKKRVMVGDWNDEWTAKARQELKSLGVDDPELRENFLDSHLARLEATSADINAKPKGNDLNPKKRKRDAQMHLFRGKQLYYMGMYPEALGELGVASILDPKNKEIQKTLDEVHQKALITN
ncbi:MAG: tetratricopeptide repeat protein [Candidatus Omnitrophota bacterium]